MIYKLFYLNYTEDKEILMNNYLTSYILWFVLSPIQSRYLNLILTVYSLNVNTDLADVCICNNQ